MRTLDRKLLRDVRGLRGQLLAIAAIVTCGVASLVSMQSMSASLTASRDAYYREARFADAFVRLRRAPDAAARDIAAVPGVAAVQTRLSFDVLVRVAGLDEPATARLLSVPAPRVPILNDLVLRAGRWVAPAPGRHDEVIASEAFALANHLVPGDTLGAVVNGRWRVLRIVGIALSPEYVYEIRDTDVFPDNRRFGVLWMARDDLADAFGIRGGFNDVSVALAADARPADVVDRLDSLLARYGGSGAYARDEHLSARFLDDEIAQTRSTAGIIPAIFLAVSAFLINIVMTRLVSTQRDQIGMLKAFGFSNAAVGRHYLGLALVPVMAGAAAGTGIGLWLAARMALIYAEFYRFPTLLAAWRPGAIGIAVGASVGAAVLGTWSAVRRAASLPPAEAMRPEPPERFHASRLERAGLRGLPPGARIVWRTITRHPVRSGLSILGVVFATAIVVTGHFMYAAIDRIVAVEFGASRRDDATVTFDGPKPEAVLGEMTRLPGVLRSEPFRVVAVRVRVGHRSRRVPLLAWRPEDELRRLVDRGFRTRPLPPAGVVLTGALADLLGVRAGDTVSLELLQGDRRVRPAVVSGLSDDLLGLSAYMDARALAALVGGAPAVSGVWLTVDANAQRALYARLERMPAVQSVTSRRATIDSYRATISRSFRITTVVLILFASVIAVGVVYNGARIALTERGRDLASLRVLGFTRGEVAAILLGEEGLVTGLAIPLGCAAGYAISALTVVAFESDLFRIPLVVGRGEYLFAVAVVAAAAVASGWLVRRRLDRMDLVAVLKTRE